MGKIVQVLSFFFGGGEGGIQFKLKFLVRAKKLKKL